MIVYKITNLINNKIYIGQTTRALSSRWNEHCKPCMVSRSYISNAIQKYGSENFIIEAIERSSSQEKLDSLEKKIY